LADAMNMKNKLNLNSQPLSLVADEENLSILDTIIEKSVVYDELCGLYCR